MASPLDSQYASGVARLIYQNQRARQQLADQGKQDDEDFNTTLKRMARQKALDLKSTAHQANREGLFYSGQLGKREGEVQHQYNDRETDERTQHDRRVAARASALNDLGQIVADPSSQLGYRGTGSAAFDLGDAYDQAIQRQVERDQSLAALVPGESSSTPAAPAATPSAAPAAAGGGTYTARSREHGGQLWVYRIGASGRPIPVRPANAFGH